MTDGNRARAIKPETEGLPVRPRRANPPEVEEIPDSIVDLISKGRHIGANVRTADAAQICRTARRQDAAQFICDLGPLAQ